MQQSMLNQLDSGPTTIFGDRPHMVSPLVMEVAKMLEKSAHDKKPNDEFETEVRLGIVALGSAGGSNIGSSRADIPCSTDAMLCRGSGFNYQFRPGLTPEAFLLFAERFAHLCSEEAPPDQRIDCGKSFEHVIDMYYEVPCATRESGGKASHTVRVTHDRSASQNITGLNAKIKNRFGVIDVSSGRHPGEHGPAFDLRVAVNTETTLDNFQPTIDHKLVFKREKRVTSYLFRAWRIDVSDVMESVPKPQESMTKGIPWKAPTIEWEEPTSSHEVEIELNAFQLSRNLDAKMRGQPHRLWELLSDFLYAARDLAGFAGELTPLALPPISPTLSLPAPPLDDAARKAFRQKYTDVPEPVVGHYLYRLASEGS